MLSLMFSLHVLELACDIDSLLMSGATKTGNALRKNTNFGSLHKRVAEGLPFSVI